MEKKRRKDSRRSASSHSSSRSTHSSKGKPAKSTRKDPSSKDRVGTDGLSEDHQTLQKSVRVEAPQATDHHRSRYFTTSSVSKAFFTTTKTGEEKSLNEKRAIASLAVFMALVAVIVMGTLLLVWFRRSGSGVARQPRNVSPTHMRSYRKWAAVVGTKECEGVPRKIFTKNGTIGDAAVASMLCVCVVMPHRCGLGGGSFAVYYNRAKKRAYAISSRERAPLAARIGMYSERDASVRGALAVAVFGELRGYNMILQATGTHVPWPELFEDAIKYARDGFVVYEDVEKFIRTLYPYYQSDTVIRAILINVTAARPLALGDRLVNSRLASTLDLASLNGPDTLSVRPMADMLAQDLKDGGGIITATDFEKFTPVLEPALSTVLSDNSRLYTVPPPSGGALLSYIVGIIDKFRRSDGSLPDNDLTWHRAVEAIKFGFGKRPNLRDPDAADISKTQRAALLRLVRSMVDANVTKAVSMQIRDKAVPDTSFYGLDRDQIIDHGSGQVCIIAPNGDAFAMASSINTEFGALFLSPHTGIWMNNVMNDFSTPYSDNVYGIPPSFPNYIEPEKRPVSSLAPAIVVGAKGDAVLAITSTGSGTISSGIAQVLTRILWMGHTVKEAIDCGRLHDQLYPVDNVKHESIADNDVIYGLRLRGHNLVQGPWEGNVIAVARDARTNFLNGSYDYRNQTSGGVDGDS